MLHNVNLFISFHSKKYNVFNHTTHTVMNNVKSIQIMPMTNDNKAIKAQITLMKG